jgi:glycosyltransferase involved in cell wall biosynthesis
MMDTAARVDGGDRSDRSPERMRVGFLAQENLPVPPPALGGSVSRVVFHLAHELVKLDAGRFDVTVSSREHPDFAEGVHDGVRYYRVGIAQDRRRHDLYTWLVRALRAVDAPHRGLQGMPFYARGYGSAGLRRLAQLDPDIVHLQSASHFVPVARRLTPSAKLVLHMHSDWLVQLPRRTVLRRLRGVDLVLGVSDYITTRIQEAYPELADRCRTLHNGTDLDLARPREKLPRELQQLTADLRARFRLGTGPVVLYVGVFAPEKGTTYLLRAFERMLGEVPDAQLILVGLHARYFQVRAPRGREARADARRANDGYRSDVEWLAATLGERVVMPGRVPHDELPAYYALADVYTMPSSSPEPFSLTVPEAMGCGVPVVATAQGGNTEIVEDGVNGLLVPPRDEAALAGALVRLCRDRPLAEAMGARARALVAQRFTWPILARRLAEYYDDLVAARPCRS